MPYNFEERYNEIREQLIKHGYANKHITYSEFLAIYEPYKEEMSEKEFTQVLGISYVNWQNVKNKGQKTIILKKEISEDEKKKLEELKQSIVLDLKKRGYTNKKIDYKEFLRLYKPYRGKLKESEFANILGISYSSWRSIKYNGTRTMILKEEKTADEKKKLEELKKFVVSDLIQKGYRNKSIDYKEFLNLYEPYKGMLEESEFANVLGIAYPNWKAIKYNGKRVIILKKELSEDEKQELEELKQSIVFDLRKKGYTNQRIDYKEFLILYEPYKEKFKESEFADILGISYSNRVYIKNYGGKTTILKIELSKDEKKELEKLKQFIVFDLKKNGYTNEKIDYNEFLRLYEPYKEKFKESEFANIIGISYANWQNIRNKGQKTIILKKEISTDEKKKLEELKNFISSDLIQKGYRNKSIDYKEFLSLYEPYRGKLKESEFANILGISYGNWQSIKNKGTKASINFDYNYNIRLAHLFKENKEYDLEYFEKVSKNLSLPVSKIVEMLTEGNTNLEELLNTLHKRGKIFIGKTKISESFIQKYGEMISDIIHKYSKSIGRKLHTSFYSEDFAQEAMLWAIENKGNIEKNFEEDLALQLIISYAKIKCKYLHYRVFSQKKVVSLDESISEDGKLTRYKRVKAKENVQDEVEKREEEIEMSEGDTPITVTQQCLLNGMNREESLEFVMKKFDLSQEELLQVLTEELSKRNSIKVAQNGEVYLGGRDIDD